jgi:glycosyltransferase involved in cell wall biosynthesis
VAVIAVVTSAPPLTDGGHLVIAHALQRALSEAGHRAGVVTTPSNRFGRQAGAYLANWWTDVGLTGEGQRVDQVISLRFPSYAVRHPQHVCWLNHTMREYYDLWETFSAGLSARGRLKERARRGVIRTVDSWLLSHNVTKVVAQSQTVQDRLRRWNGVAADVVHPPPPQRPYRCDGYGNYLFFTSRLAPLKRAGLLLQALATPAAAHVRCIIGGEGEELRRLQLFARERGLDRRVMFTGRLDEDALVRHLAACRAVVFVPRDEDYGFVTVEAFASGKAVITCTDSGGPLEHVRDGQNGLVTAPDPEALGRACARLFDDAAEAERLGTQARNDVARLTWDGVVRKLLIL